MGTHGVEILQKHCIPVCLTQVQDHFLSEELGFEVGVGIATCGVGPIQGKLLGVPVM